MLALRGARKFCWHALLLLLAACSNGRGSLDAPPAAGAGESFSIGGSVSGLEGSGLTLQNNGGDDLQIGSDGAFTFGARVTNGGAYNVTVASQPANPAQTCTIANGTGTVASGNVVDVAVTCASAEGIFTVSGTVSGLEGAGLILQLNGIEGLAIASSGSFTFAAPLAGYSPGGYAEGAMAGLKKAGSGVGNFITEHPGMAAMGVYGLGTLADSLSRNDTPVYQDASAGSEGMAAGNERSAWEIEAQYPPYGSNPYTTYPNYD